MKRECPMCGLEWPTRDSDCWFCGTGLEDDDPGIGLGELDDFDDPLVLGATFTIVNEYPNWAVSGNTGEDDDEGDGHAV